MSVAGISFIAIIEKEPVTVFRSEYAVRHISQYMTCRAMWGRETQAIPAPRGIWFRRVNPVRSRRVCRYP